MKEAIEEANLAIEEVKKKAKKKKKDKKKRKLTETNGDTNENDMEGEFKTVKMSARAENNYYYVVQLSIKKTWCFR